MQALRKWLQPDRSPPVVVVSGLPRSGTSMMMQMVVAGGVPPLADDHRPPDVNNPKGYYEFEHVKALEAGDTAWVADARGKSVKVISALLQYLPAAFRYKVIFMQRDLDEILRSQQAMLAEMDKPTEHFDDYNKLQWQYEKHLHTIRAWLDEQPHMQLLYMSHRQMVQDPATCAAQVNHFLGGDLNEQAMQAVVDPQLYRQRPGN